MNADKKKRPRTREGTKTDANRGEDRVHSSRLCSRLRGFAVSAGFSYLRPSAFICASIILLSGCASAVSQGTNTALSGVDLVKMTDDMAMKIAGDSEVQRAIEQRG